jgi:hypothetical protein
MLITLVIIDEIVVVPAAWELPMVAQLAIRNGSHSAWTLEVANIASRQ